MVALLLASGAAVDATNHLNGTPLLYAVYKGHTNAVGVLLAHKADPNRFGLVQNRGNNNWEYVQPVYTAIMIRSDEILKLVLDAGANPEGVHPWTSRNPPYESPLFAAVDYNSVTAVQLLLDHGANPNFKTKDGNPPLDRVLRNGRDKQMVPLLLAKGADPNAKNQYGAPPLFYAEDPEVARQLIEHQADVNAQLAEGKTPLMSLAHNSNVVAVLIDSGAKVDTQDNNGNAALHMAVYYSSPGSVALLLAHKANPNIQNNLGYTPRDLAEAGKQGFGLGMMLGSNTGSQPPPKEAQVQIAGVLVNAGGLVNLPKRNRIEVRRASDSGVAFTKGSHDWNRYSLLEVIADSYNLLSEKTTGDWRSRTFIRGEVFGTRLGFPDFKRVVIYRRTDASAKQKEIDINVEEILKTGDCSKDVWLEWGDVVEIREADHPLDQKWRGLSDEEVTSLTNCVSRRVTLRIKGEDTVLTLGPRFLRTNIMSSPGEREWDLTPASFMLRSVLDNSKLVRVSSDLSHVKATRVDPETKKKQEWTVDCTNPAEADLWVRDGDVIEVPEKS
jgi:ankyrin repeat protein